MFLPLTIVSFHFLLVLISSAPLSPVFSSTLQKSLCDNLDLYRICVPEQTFSVVHYLDGDKAACCNLLRSTDCMVNYQVKNNCSVPVGILHRMSNRAKCKDYTDLSVCESSLANLSPTVSGFLVTILIGFLILVLCVIFRLFVANNYGSNRSRAHSICQLTDFNSSIKENFLNDLSKGSEESPKAPEATTTATIEADSFQDLSNAFKSATTVGSNTSKTVPNVATSKNGAADVPNDTSSAT